MIEKYESFFSSLFEDSYSDKVEKIINNISLNDVEDILITLNDEFEIRYSNIDIFLTDEDGLGKFQIYQYGDRVSGLHPNGSKYVAKSSVKDYIKRKNKEVLLRINLTYQNEEKTFLPFWMNKREDTLTKLENIGKQISDLCGFSGSSFNVMALDESKWNRSSSLFDLDMFYIEYIFSF